MFTFNCWLGQEHYFVSVAAHTPDGEAFDWLDGVIFFRVSCAVEMEGIANLNAQVATRRLPFEAHSQRGTTGDVEPTATPPQEGDTLSGREVETRAVEA